jgi:CubicO group peptidase (beta-lactamase class C family)
MLPFESAKTNLRHLAPSLRGPGFQYCMVEGRRIRCHAEGIADLRTGIPVDHRTTFLAFSVTKPFVAVAVMRMVEAGLLALSDSIGRYVDSLPYSPEPDLGQLLGHTAGIPNPLPLDWVHPAEDHAGFDERGFIYGLFRKHSRSASKPGTRFAYSNLGYLLAGLAVEGRTGMGLASHLEASLVPALSLDTNDFLGFSIPDPGRHARGCIGRWSPARLIMPFFSSFDRLRDGAYGRWIQLRPFQVNGTAYGGLVANASGLARFTRALLAPGLLADSSLARMFPTAGSRGESGAKALGWFSGSLDGIPYFAHAGGGGGYYCEIRLYPGRGRASVFMSNRTGMTDERLLDRIDRGTGL